MRKLKRPFKRVPAEISVAQLTPNDITCGSTKCDDGFIALNQTHKH
jgi:hypothetical protein